jgi:hypothetical protein
MGRGRKADYGQALLAVIRPESAWLACRRGYWTSGALGAPGAATMSLVMSTDDASAASW